MDQPSTSPSPPLPPTTTAQKSFVTLQIAFVTGLSLWLMTQGIFPSPELLFILLVAALVWKASYRSFLIDFIPFLLMLLTYQALRGFADNLSPSAIHVTDLIAWERALFGGMMPPAYLQAHLQGQPYTPLLNLVTNALYMSHFVVPVLLAVVLWFYRREHYWPFGLGLLALSYAGFLTYLLFPAAPPWWAAHFGYLKEETVQLTNFILPTAVVFAGPNPVAAMPSLHAAYPTYIALFVLSVWGQRFLWVLLLPLGVGFSAVYLGHHYVIDLIAGALYAVVAFTGVHWWGRRAAHSAERGS